MSPSPNPGAVIAFGPFRFDPDARLLSRDGVAVKVTPKAADLLRVLLESPGRVLSKDELIRTVWPGTFVDDGALTYHVHLLRQALGDEAARPVYIETLPKRGYRFIAELTVPADEVFPSPPVAQTPAPAPSAAAARAGYRPLPIAGIVAAMCLLALSAIRVTGNQAIPRVVRMTPLTHDGHVVAGLFVASESTLLANAGHTHVLVRTDGTGIEPVTALGMYNVLDVSAARGEALATRPDDPGAETGLWAVSLDGRRSRRLGAIRTSFGAAWSHDGRRIAYCAQHTLFVADSDGGVVRSSTTFTGEPMQVRWSHDDRLLRVHVRNASDRQVTVLVYDVSPGDGLPRLVFSPTPHMDRFTAGDWLENSDAYIGGCTDGLWAQLCVLRVLTRFIGAPTADARALDTSVVAPGYQFGSPVPAADGKRIFAIGETRAALERFDDRSHTFSRFLDGLSAFAVSYSRDGRFFTYISYPEMVLWRAQPDGSNRVQLTFPPAVVDASALSPDGGTIAVRMGVGEQHKKIYLMPSGGGAAQPIDPRDVEQGSPSWAPDGKHIVYGDVPETFAQPNGHECLHVYDLATRRVSDLPASETLWSSRWSPDGAYIAAYRISDRTLMLYTLATRTWRELGVKGVAELAWSPDARYLYVEPEPSAIWWRRVSMPTGSVEQLLDLSLEARPHSGAGFAADGAPLLLRARRDVFALEVSTKPR